MPTILAFIFMFGLLVFVHELGHLIFAKRAGMLAREFAIGFGPKIFSFMKNETLYTIRLLPIGGYVRVAGEDPEIVELKPGHHIGLEFSQAGKVNRIIVNNKSKYPNARVIEVEQADLDHKLMIQGYEIDEDEKLIFDVEPDALFVMDEKETQIAPYDRQFASKTVPQRAMQLFAGPMMNFLLAIVIFYLLAMIQGVPSNDSTLGKLTEDGPAQEAGLQQGDKVAAVGGENVGTWVEFVEIIQEKPNETVELSIVRDGENLMVPVKTGVMERNGEEVGKIGVFQPKEKSMTTLATYGFTKTYEITTMILTNLGQLVTGQLSIDQLSGPVGIYNATDEVVSMSWANYLPWIAMLSINLGIINLVPLPALDGGRLLFVGVEAVRGKPIEPQKEAIVHFIGFALLMLLMIVVTWNDIQRLFL
ncbi:MULTISPECIES: RIP metalloprotease RseP [Pontibacillus]|uniref:Zinc metalloprotease n=1 Tax=Pontibacillus chungwhensis TaxID=265426 RepID=A0ABY8V2M6_9BACI|nr:MULTISPECIES: RIP metalloprotease RseP [Pontibacillus]MCD5322719.1 RIP metalloprotease RseP [Pontibacillus sp. HN14]WIF99994.1 RIP metalloprotease RseP [Pontibacillus chungwhensis]